MKNLVKRICPIFFIPYFRLINNLTFRGATTSLRKINYLKTKNSLVVLGNGPSLDDDIERLDLLIPVSDFLCVNNFACSELYEKYRPDKYLFMDDYFFSKNAHPDWIKQRNSTFKSINEKTRWKLQIYLPSQANMEVIRNKISNENIDFIRFSATGYINPDFKLSFFHFNTGFFGPFQGNVLIYAIYLGIWAKYKNIRVFGADLSLQENIKVDQATNELYITFRHFNNSAKKEKFLKNPNKTEAFKMHEFLLLSAETFFAHQVLSEYAKSKKINIYNCSSYSLIDAYRRDGN